MKNYGLIIASIAAIAIYSCDGGSKANVSTNSVDSTNINGVAPVEYNSPKENLEPLVDSSKTPDIGELPEKTKPDLD